MTVLTTIPNRFKTTTFCYRELIINIVLSDYYIYYTVSAQLAAPLRTPKWDKDNFVVADGKREGGRAARRIVLSGRYTKQIHVIRSRSAAEEREAD